MSNTFLSFDVPAADGAGAAVDLSRTGGPKTIFFTGESRGRFLVEATLDGTHWDTLIADRNLPASFSRQKNKPRTIACIVKQLRVRRAGGVADGTRPALTLGAPPALGTNVFGTLEVPVADGVGAAFDLGRLAGPLKTFVVRGQVPRSARYTLQGSFDGQHFQDLLLFQGDGNGARSVSALCRYLRVAVRKAAVPVPSVTVGVEGLFVPAGDGGGGGGGGGSGGGDDQPGTDRISFGEESKKSTIGQGEEVLAEYAVPMGVLRGPKIRATLAGFFSAEGQGGGEARFQLRVGGRPGEPDGEVLLRVTERRAGGTLQVASCSDVPLPQDPAAIVKLTGQGSGEGQSAIRAALRGFLLALDSVEG